MFKRNIYDSHFIGDETRLISHTVSSCHNLRPMYCQQFHTVKNYSEYINYIITTIKKRCLPLRLHGLYGEI